MGNFQSKISLRVLILGLDSAGKTTLLKGITGGDRSIEEGPTASHNTGHLKFRGSTAIFFDLGGQQRLISMWRQYFVGTGLILFIIDSSDKQRLDEAKIQLHSLNHEQDLLGIPLLVLANKQDMQDALSPEEIAHELELSYFAPRPIHVLGTSAKSKQGFSEVLDWIQEHAVTFVQLPTYIEEYRRKVAEFAKKTSTTKERSLTSKKDSNGTVNLTTAAQPNSPNVPPADGSSGGDKGQEKSTTSRPTNNHHDALSNGDHNNDPVSNSHHRAPRHTISIHHQERPRFDQPYYPNVDGEVRIQPGDMVIETVVASKDVSTNNNSHNNNNNHKDNNNNSSSATKNNQHEMSSHFTPVPESQGDDEDNNNNNKDNTSTSPQDTSSITPKDDDDDDDDDDAQ